jgi:uncharacterized damage-inducible protein DinB
VDPIRETLARALEWKDAHATFDDAVADFPAELRGVRPAGVPWSAWQLVEHIRIAQQDILEFSLPGEYRESAWPADYWPTEPAPRRPEAWDDAIAAIRRDREALQRLARDPAIDLAAITPHGTAHQIYLRAVLLTADHTSYHVGQLVLLRRLLGVWQQG